MKAGKPDPCLIQKFENFEGHGHKRCRTCCQLLSQAPTNLKPKQQQTRVRGPCSCADYLFSPRLCFTSGCWVKPIHATTVEMME